MPVSHDDPVQPHPHRSLARRLEGLNVYLVGMMGAGKSAAGRPLAQALGYCFVDADHTLMQASGCTIADLFARDGEAGFRDLETAVLNAIAIRHSLVVATGGGVVTRPQNWGHMRQGVVVWLEAPASLLLDRLSRDPTVRPLMAAADPALRLEELLAARRPLYEQADLHILQEQGDSPERVAERILEALPSILRSRDQPPSKSAEPAWHDQGQGPSMN